MDFQGAGSKGTLSSFGKSVTFKQSGYVRSTGSDHHRVPDFAITAFALGIPEGEPRLSICFTTSIPDMTSPAATRMLSDTVTIDARDSHQRRHRHHPTMESELWS